MTNDVRVGEANLSPEQWDNAVAQFPGATFFHQYEWLQLVREVYGGEPHYLAATNGSKVCGMLPLMVRRVIGAGRVAISVPLADEAGSLATTPDVEEALLSAARELGVSSRVSHVEVRQRHEPPSDLPVDLSRVGVELSLPDDADTLWDDFRATIRNQVRKATKSGLQMTIESDPHSAVADAFYPIYSENTRDLGSPMHSVRFFHEVANRFPEAVHVAIVRLGDDPVGAGFALRWRDRLMVPWASSLRRYFSMCPNMILYWGLMRLAIEQGCRVFDFGRSPRDSGTFRFKTQWGGEAVPLYYCYIPVLRQPEMGEKRDSPAYRAFSAVWPKVPLPLARALGPKVFSRLPI